MNNRRQFITIYFICPIETCPTDLDQQRNALYIWEIFQLLVCTRLPQSSRPLWCIVLPPSPPHKFKNSIRPGHSYPIDQEVHEWKTIHQWSRCIVCITFEYYAKTWPDGRATMMVVAVAAAHTFNVEIPSVRKMGRRSLSLAPSIIRNSKHFIYTNTHNSISILFCLTKHHLFLSFAFD